MNEKRPDINKILLLLGLLAGPVAYSQFRPSIMTDEERAKRVSWKDDCDLDKTPWNSFKMTVYESSPSVVDRTLEVSPLTRKALANPKLRADDQKTIAEIKRAIHRIETTYKRNSLGEIFWDDQDEIKRLQSLIDRIERGEMLFNAPRSSLQGRGIVEIMAAHNVGWNGRAKVGEELEELRAQVQPDLGRVIESFPCETKNMRACAVAYPRKINTLNTIVVDDNGKPESVLNRLYQRTNRIKIDHCLRDYPMTSADRETIRKACEEWPRRTEDGDVAYRDVRDIFIACRDALNGFLESQRNIPRNERGKYLPKDHK